MPISHSGAADQAASQPLGLLPSRAPESLLGGALAGGSGGDLAQVLVQAFEHSPSGLAVVRLPEQRYVHANRAFCAMVGRDPATVLTLTPRDVGHPQDPEPIDDAVLGLHAGESHRSERRYLRPDGSAVWARRTVTVIRDAGGAPSLVLAQYEDITEVAAAAQRAEENEQFLRSVLDSLATRTAVLDPEGVIIAVNADWSQAAHDNPGMQQGAAPGSNYLEQLDSSPDTFHLTAADGIRSVLHGDEDEFALDYPAHASPKWFNMRVRRMPLAGAVVSHTDITVRRENEERMAFSTLHDELTGLPNRTLFIDRLKQAVARSSRRLTSTAVLFLDLDDFKLVNDSLGHRTGDLLLMEVAHRLSNALRPGDTVARFGGDEFAILCEELVGEEQALDLAERLLQALEEPLQVATREVTMTGSIGIALSADCADPDALLRDADAAMYRAKERGRGRCELFDQRLRHRALRRLELEQDLRRALEEQEFLIAYQPVVDLGTGIATHVEALVRWLHPERGLVPPADFIPVAEDTGQIVAVGRWILREACRQAATWRDELGYDITVAVNLSTKQLTDPLLVSTVQSVLADTGLPGNLLCLEITESAIMQDANASVEVMGRLRRLGVRLSVDDFGTGYSSLSYLRRFPIDQLKIDRSFVNALDNDADDVALVNAIIELARNLRMSVVAEGVERPDQAQLLSDLGCEKAQGYLYAKPMPGQDVTALLNRPLPLSRD